MTDTEYWTELNGFSGAKFWTELRKDFEGLFTGRNGSWQVPDSGQSYNGVWVLSFGQGCVNPRFLKRMNDVGLIYWKGLRHG